MFDSDDDDFRLEADISKLLKIIDDSVSILVLIWQKTVK